MEEQALVVPRKEEAQQIQPVVYFVGRSSSLEGRAAIYRHIKRL